MPKVVDNYVLQRKIGSGQYGDVFKGYNKNNRQDIAIKAIKRENIKGKFNELLQNEIKVLKTCDNINIIKLYDLKKTSNNIYLILQYCNEGDLMVYLKQKKSLPQDEAIEYFIQILNAFKTLVKHKIMHRDFKLANILKHDGQIKIADFGFSKLLTHEDYTSTMLGSPLNMAPQVLGGNEYNNKADIWSIGTVFYELLFGKTPYTASNMVDLITNIKNKPLVFPKNINNISQVTQDVIKKMLVLDPKKRIDWEDLFNHPINHHLQDKMKKDLEETLHQGEDISMNMSKFYIKANMVIDHPNEIAKKQSINNYAIDVVKGKSDNGFKGEVIKRNNIRKEQSQNDTKKTEDTEENKNDDGKISQSQTQRQKQIKIFKRNANRLLHYRNIYVFLASVAEQALNNISLKISQIIGYLLIKKLLELIQWLKTNIESKKGFPQMKNWESFMKQKDYFDIKQYIAKQYDVFGIFYQSVYSKLLKQKQKLKAFGEDVEKAIINSKENSDKVLNRLLKDYAKQNMQIISNNMNKQKSLQPFRKSWIHIDRILDCLNIDQVFKFETNGVIFNFRDYYEINNRITNQQLVKKVKEKYEKLK